MVRMTRLLSWGALTVMCRGRGCIGGGLGGAHDQVAVMGGTHCDV